METPIPNPFNGAEMFNGQSHHRAPGHTGHPGAFDDEDFGPETDVDMVDDVLLSPAIAAAKALVHGANEDDYERQRQQMKEFDDPVDLDRSRDTPTPPAHEEARDASGENLAESGGEESEEEWNYIPGKDTQNQGSVKAESKEDEEDMNSQLNPNAAEFVPVSPTRHVMDDPIIASSPVHGFEKSLDNIQLPSELEFTSEISQRPSDLEYSNGPKHGDGYFDDDSTLHNKVFNVPLDGSEQGNEPIANFNVNTQENVSFDKLAAVQNIEEKVTSAVLEKANIFGMNNDFSNNASEATNIFGKSDPMTASFMGKDLPSSPEPEDVLVPGTPRSTTVEAPSSPTDEISPAIHQTDLDSPADDFAADTQKSSDLISPGDGPQEGLISVQERTSSSGFESESGADEVEPNIINNEGYTTEHRNSSPLDHSFTPIQTFSVTNPFGTLQTPSSTNPMDQFDIPVESLKETQLETPKKDLETDKDGDKFDYMQDTPSFISTRSPLDEPTTPFDQLESPEEVSHFAHPPNANSSFLDTDLPESSEIPDEIENLSPLKPELNESATDNYRTNVNDITQELFSEDTNPEIEETSFITEKPHISEVSHTDLDSTEGFLETESKILQDEKECEETSKLIEDLKIESGNEMEATIPSPVSPRAVEQVLAAFDEIKSESRPETKHELLEESRDVDIEVETKEMKLEFESHIVNSPQRPQTPEMDNLGEDFEIVNKDNIVHDDVHSEDLNTDVTKPVDNAVIVEKELEEVINLTSSVKETNPFKMDDDDLTPSESIPEKQEFPVGFQNTVNNDLFSAIDQFSTAVNEDITSSENSTLLSQEPQLKSEPEATKTVSYQTLTPANEPPLTKSESYVTGEEDKVKSSILEEIVPETAEPAKDPVPIEKEEPIVIEEETSVPVEIELPVESIQKCEPVQSTVVTETLITALEETSEVPSVATTEVPSSAGTPPPTPAPGLDDSKESQDTPKTDILGAAVAAAGAVAAGSAILAEKESKETKEVSKKPVGAKKPSDVTTKSAGKSLTSKAPAPKTAAAKSTTITNKQSLSKPATTTNKTLPAKLPLTSVAAKKPTTASAPKLPTTKPAAAKPLAPTLKSVPKQLPITKTATLKPMSKQSTPTSKPTTPTTPKSPMVKSDSVKSPARPGLKSPVGTKATLPPKPTVDKVSEKKPLTNGDIKLPPKKAEPKKTAITARAAPLPKTAPSAPKAPAIKNTAARPSVTNAAKTNLTSTTALKSAPASMRSTAGKISDKSGKEAANKLVSSPKPSLNGKSSPGKTAGGLKKTDPKANGKPGTKPPPIRKPEEAKKEEEKAAQIQEANVTTTNGFADHNDHHESLKIEDLAPVTVETLN